MSALTPPAPRPRPPLNRSSNTMSHEQQPRYLVFINQVFLQSKPAVPVTLGGSLLPALRRDYGGAPDTCCIEPHAHAPDPGHRSHSVLTASHRCASSEDAGMYAPGEQCSQDQNDHCGVGHNWNEPIKDPELANCKRHGIVLMLRHRPVQQPTCPAGLQLRAPGSSCSTAGLTRGSATVGQARSCRHGSSTRAS